jgi:hypothetical protein
MPGLPDGLFSNQKSKFGQIVEGLAMEDDGIFYGRLVHLTVFGYILWTFGIFCGNLVYCLMRQFEFLHFCVRQFDKKRSALPVNMYIHDNRTKISILKDGTHMSAFETARRPSRIG